MRKIIFIIIAIAVSGCAVKKSRSTGNPALLTGNIIENTKFQNLSDKGYFIQKGEIEVVTEGGKQKFNCTIKFEKPDKYLISVKSKTGIEGARIYITKDSILVNDRINKKLYSGTSSYLKLKYGVSVSLLPLIFGDIILDARCENKTVKCINDISTFNCPVKGTYLTYTVDCKKSKISSVTLTDQDINVKFDKYFILSNILVPRTIAFSAGKSNMEINIRIVKVEYPWSGNIGFVPGRGYEKIELR